MSEFVEYTAPEWRGLNMRALKVDEAYVIIKNFFNQSCFLYILSDECYTCPFTKAKILYQNENDKLAKNNTLVLSGAQGWQFKILPRDEGVYSYKNDIFICQFGINDMKEFGIYNLTLTSQGDCDFKVDKDGVNIYLGLLSAFLVILLSFSVLKVCVHFYKAYECEATVTERRNIDESNIHSRIRSLDAFRGFCIVLMIFVNSGGGSYWWVKHATWNGLHLADIVFPSFLWIMGVCLPISVRSQLEKGFSKRYICERITWRSIKLFLIGVCLNSINGPNFANLRIMGVLQRFGISYWICGVVHIIFGQKQYIIAQESWKRNVLDLLIFKCELITMFILISVHTSIIFLLPISNCPTGYLGPGGKHSNANYPNCIGGATGYIDRIILGQSHIYQHPTAKYIYDSSAFDPEGIFGCLLTVVQVIFGMLTGVIIMTYTTWQARMKRWILWSILLAVMAGILCGFTQENGIIPVNKNLWSLSYVFLTSSICFFTFTLLYLVIDVKESWNGCPFGEAGMNSIFLYIGHTILHKMLPWHWRIEPMNTHFILFLESAWNTFLWICIALYLDVKKIYCRL